MGGLSLQTLNFAPNFCLSDAVEDGGAETQSSSGVNCPPANEANERLALSLPLLSNMNRKCQEDNSLATPPLDDMVDFLMEFQKKHSQKKIHNASLSQNHKDT